MANVRTVNIAFTGIAALWPAPPADNETAGPIVVVLPRSPRARGACDGKTQIDAHHVFAVVDFDQIKSGSRHADLKLPSEAPKKGAILLHDEIISVTPAPSTDRITYNTTQSTAPGALVDARKIANFTDITGGRARFKKGGSPPMAGRIVRFEFPGGFVSAKYSIADSPEVEFRYFGNVLKSQYAHQMVVSLSYPMEVKEVSFRSIPLSQCGTPAGDLTLQFLEAYTIDMTVGNGPIDSLMAVMTKDRAAHDHVARDDFEFEIFYDVIDCPPDPSYHRPIPRVSPSEVKVFDCFPLTMAVDPTD